MLQVSTESFHNAISDFESLQINNIYHYAMGHFLKGMMHDKKNKKHPET